MKINYKYSDNTFQTQIEYVFHIFEYLLGIDFQRDSKSILSITYGKKEPTNLNSNYHIHIHQSDQLFNKTNYSYGSSLPDLPLVHLNLKKYEMLNTKKFTSSTLPIIYPKNKFCDLKIKNTESGKLLLINFDLIASIFFMLTRYEEYISDSSRLDKNGRFPAVESVAYKEKFLSRPIVNEYIELLWEIIQYFDLGYNRKKIWGDNNFGVFLTHDVDVIQKYTALSNLFNPIYTNLKNRKFQRVTDNIKNFFLSSSDYKRDPYWTFDYMINLEKKYNFKSTFFFLVHNRHKYDGDYNFDSKEIQKLIYKLIENDIEIGLHLSYDSFDKYDLMKNQIKYFKNCLSRSNLGVRQHYLRFDVKNTWEYQNKNNILYDTSLSYADRSGFRNGICHPFQVYSLTSEKKLDLWEIPLNVMEATLKRKNYMNLSINKAYEYTTTLIDSVKLYNGVFTFLWHNNNFSGEWIEWNELYKKILKYIDDKNGIGLTGREIINKINDREQ